MRKVKFLISILAAMVLLLMVTGNSFGQNEKKDLAEIKIKTSAVCGMCKDKIESALAFEKGVKESNLDLKTKEVTVKYKPSKTTPEKIRLAISKTGYDADEVAADPKAYEKLSPCCKKGNTAH